MAKSNLDQKKEKELSTSLANITTYQSGVAQATAFRIVKKHTAAALKSYGLTCNQWFTIGTVLDAGPAGIRLSDLAKSLDTTLGYMTNTVNLLEARDILVKVEYKADARTRLIAVSDSYVKECEEIEGHLRRCLGKVLYGNISGEELLAYINVLYKISSIK